MLEKPAARVIPIIAQGKAVAPAGEALKFHVPPPLSLYVHVPWCVQKCPYCDFNSHQVRDALPEKAYIAALIADLEAALPQVWGRKIDTVYFGGGTPSYLGHKRLIALLKTVKKQCRVWDRAEITLEANPDSAGDWRALRALRRAGFNRISLGVQSSDDETLAAAGPGPHLAAGEGRRGRLPQGRAGQHQPGPDLRSAGPDYGAVGKHPGRRPGAGSPAHLLLRAEAGGGDASV